MAQNVHGLSLDAVASTFTINTWEINIRIIQLGIKKSLCIKKTSRNLTAFSLQTLGSEQQIFCQLFPCNVFC